MDFFYLFDSLGAGGEKTALSKRMLVTAPEVGGERKCIGTSRLGQSPEPIGCGRWGSLGRGESHAYFHRGLRGLNALLCSWTGLVPWEGDKGVGVGPPGMLPGGSLELSL